MFPYLQEVSNPSKKYTVNFRGINYGEGTQDGEFADTLNLSTDQYPCITQRAARIMDGEYASPSTLHSKGKLLVIDGKDVLYDGKKVGEVEPGKKQTATVGNYIVIFPDKKYYKVPTEDDQDGEFGCMDVEIANTQFKFSKDTINVSYEFKEQWYDFTSSSISVGTVFKKTGIAFKSEKEIRLNLGVGEKAHLTAVFTPSNATDKPVWTSDALEVATVDSETGVVTAKSFGKATIKVQAGSVSATCVVNVK